MRTSTIVLVSLCCLASLLPASVAAQSAPDSVAFYNLGSKSAFTYGCFAPCVCPVHSSRPLQGTFQLRHTGFDGLYENYDVMAVRWVVSDNTANVVITGSGHYRIGGEFAIQKQMTLDLQFGSAPPQRFDSGIVSGGNDFPKIEIDVSLHQSTCFDSVIHIQASPATATSVGPGGSSPRASLVKATPNPFTEGTNLALELPAPARVDLSIYDAQGHLIRRLALGAWLPAGAPSIAWDGKREDGTNCSSGVYFVRGRIGDAPAVRRIVKAR